MQKQESSRCLTRNRPSDDTNNENDDDKNALLSELLSDPTHESPPKRLKQTMASPRSLNKHRTFGEEIGGNNMLDAANISMLSMESKDTTATHLTEDTASDCATEVSSVAMLRGWLDDFGQKSKTHYVKNTVPNKQPSEQQQQQQPVAPAPRVNKSLVPTTPLPPHHHAPLASKRQVAPSIYGAKPLEQAAFKPPLNKSAVPTTPLQPYAPSAIRRTSIGSTSSSIDKPPAEELPLERPTRPKVSRTFSSAPPTPLPYNSASVIKRMMNDSKNKAAGSGKAVGGGGMSIRNKGMTPIRIKPAYNKDEVQSTDTTRTSVAKLSAWLADDPTTTKKVKQIRRGANIIAKSRQFDKGLANVIVEQNNIRSGSVASKKDWLEIASSTEGDSNNTDDDFSSWNGSASNQKSWLDGQRMNAANQDSASSFSVSNKKAWLNNAFKKADGTNALVPKAQTDVGTNQEERDDLSSRAKHMWRNRAPSHRSPVRRTPAMRPPVNRSPTKEAPKERMTYRPQTEVKPDARRETITAFPTKEATKERSIFKTQTEVKPDARREIITAISTSEATEESSISSQTEVKPDARREIITAISTSEATEESSISSQTEVKPDDRREIDTAFPTLAISEQFDSPVNFDASFPSLSSEQFDSPVVNFDASFPSLNSEQFDSPVVFDSAAFPTATFPNLAISNSEQSESPVNFNSARDKIVQRSKTSGKGVEVLSKVKIRKAKYERLQKDSRRMSAPLGLLKPSWDEADASVGPSNSYTKKYVEDIVPRKSWEELP
jgi:hypothetical protein